MAVDMHTAYLVMGPTASGKTALSILLAEHLKTAILSADSRQCYRELSIGVARPSAKELQQVPHYFIASHSIHEPVDVAVFERYALQTATQVFAHHASLVVCGGTGLYLKAFTNGIDDLPPITAAIRAAVNQRWEQEGISGLQNWLTDIDPEFLLSNTEASNPVRLMRALEVMLSSGRSIRTFQTGQKAERPFKIKKIFIDWPRELLYERINQRVDAMMANGLLEEVRDLVPYRNLKALQTVGYQELFDHLEGLYSLDEAIERIKQHTRNYAKRQLTWFRKFGWDKVVPGEVVVSGDLQPSTLLG
jgi:tRNA dimethylallyltransferase